MSSHQLALESFLVGIRLTHCPHHVRHVKQLRLQEQKDT
jgi:hypothetical protein